MSLALSSFPKLYVPFHYIFPSCEYFDLISAWLKHNLAHSLIAASRREWRKA